MSLGLIGLLTIVIMLGLIMSKKLSTLLALIIVPILGYFAAKALNLLSGQDMGLGKLITEGIKNIAPTGVMFIFAILFFGILTDAGTFDPIIKRTLKIVGNDPVKICIGTVVLASLVHLDGSGAVTFLIVIPAMLPLYESLGMKKTVLATCAALGAGTMNMVPWGGPTIRAITALESSSGEVFTPMLPSLGAGLVFIILSAIYLGNKEKKRISKLDIKPNINIIHEDDSKEEIDMMKRPKLFWVNIILIVVSVYVLVRGILPPEVVFMISTVIAMICNYPDIELQRKLMDKHAPSALMMASMLFAAGAFTGIIKGSGMLDSMAQGLVSLIPESLGTKIPLVTGVFSMPLSLVFDPDSYYYGVLPVISTAAHSFGIEPVMVARASIIGQMTTGFPISPLTGATFLLTGLAGVDLGEHQKSTIPFAFLTTIVMLVVGIIAGAIVL
ncbi:MAG: citrate:proton symporter [Clostridiales bacterium]|nr:citrate:proton symporter [Clostridiales bacterium]MDY4060216.1 citrate:proton symporter [Anaerovoracaceae bacterium]